MEACRALRVTSPLPHSWGRPRTLDAGLSSFGCMSVQKIVLEVQAFLEVCLRFEQPVKQYLEGKDEMMVLVICQSTRITCNRARSYPCSLNLDAPDSH